MSSIFTKTKENFTCEHCGEGVKGDGYTNHCPKCLWSKHVDVNPGDRAADCQGMMRPVSYQAIGASFDLTHRCERCGMEKRNKLAPNDQLDLLPTL